MFERMLPRILALSPTAVATHTHELFGYSAQSGVEALRKELLQYDQFQKLVKTIDPHLERLKVSKAPNPQAANLFAALYTVRCVDHSIVYLTDFEAEQLWSHYSQGRMRMKELRQDADQMDQHGRGYFEALHAVFGYSVQREMEDVERDPEWKLLMASLAVKKADLFSELIAVNEQKDDLNMSDLPRDELVRVMASDMLTYYRMFWYGRALDHFELSCFAREFFHGDR
jgi:hypothetical protein